MSTLDVRVVSVDRMLWQGVATSVVAKTTEGEIGILPKHEPVLALLADGEVRIELAEGGTISAAVHGGFFAVDANEVAILAESAELASDIDIERARAALERARHAEANDVEAAAALRRAEVRLAIATGR